MVGALAVDSGLDFLTGGKLNKYKRKAALAIYRTIVRPVAARAVPSVGRSLRRKSFVNDKSLRTWRHGPLRRLSGTGAN